MSLTYKKGSAILKYNDIFTCQLEKSKKVDNNTVDRSMGKRGTLICSWKGSLAIIYQNYDPNNSSSKNLLYG